jgi:hypothetical protein
MLGAHARLSVVLVQALSRVHCMVRVTGWIVCLCARARMVQPDSVSRMAAEALERRLIHDRTDNASDTSPTEKEGDSTLESERAGTTESNGTDQGKGSALQPVDSRHDGALQ